MQSRRLPAPQKPVERVSVEKKKILIAVEVANSDSRRLVLDQLYNVFFQSIKFTHEHCKSLVTPEM